jgi:hypothetical protein
MADLKSQIAQRFKDLAEQGRAIPLLNDQGSMHASPSSFYTWATSVLNLLQGVFGENPPHAIRFKRELDSIEYNYVDETKLDAIRGIFLGAKSDFDGGYIFNVEAALTGEVFGDFVTAAKAALTEGHHTVAAVLASAALEDALKRYATINGLDVAGKSMQEVVNALKSKGLVSGAQKSLLDSMPKVRDYAMHAEWSKITPQDAGSVIGFVEQFLLANFR